jgi:hypothetical protein
MNTLHTEIIHYNINNYLTLEDKINLIQVSKKFYPIQKKTINYHIGEIISNKLGLTIKDDYDLVKLYPKDTLLEIIEILFNDNNDKNKYDRRKRLKYNMIKLKNIVKIRNASKETCIKMLLKDKLAYTKNYNSNYYLTNFNKKSFYMTYVLI